MVCKTLPVRCYKESKAVFGSLEKYIFPVLGRIPIEKIEVPMVFNMVEKIQEAGFVETGQRVNSYCSMMFRYGVAKGYCKRDVTQDYKGMTKVLVITE